MGFVISMTVDGTTRELDLNSMMLSEAQECRRLTGMHWHEWRSELFESDATAIAFAWWLACKRAGEPLEGSFASVDFDLGTADMHRVVEDDMPVEEVDPDLPTGPPEAA